MELIIDGREYINIVPRGYKMDPTSEDLLYGDELENGMVVLISDGLYDETQPELHNQGLLEKNRWCEVSKIRVVDEHVCFIGIYTDGSKKIRMSNGTRGWLVKHETIPDRSSLIPQPKFTPGEDDEVSLAINGAMTWEGRRVSDV